MSTEDLRRSGCALAPRCRWLSHVTRAWLGVSQAARVWRDGGFFSPPLSLIKLFPLQNSGECDLVAVEDPSGKTLFCFLVFSIPNVAPKPSEVLYFAVINFIASIMECITADCNHVPLNKSVACKGFSANKAYTIFICEF